jgi:tripartite-type tricarboxylate transporter receptor subunit TctC
MVIHVGRRHFISALGAATAAWSFAAHAEDQYPARTVRIIVPSTPGGITDLLARVMGQVLTQSWGQPVIIENRPGADELVGTETVVKAPADGYMLLVASNAAITAAPSLHSRLPYDPQKDLTPILMLGQITPVMIVPSSLPVTSVQEFIALAKAKPGELNYGSFGNGTYPHVAMEDFKLRTGTQILHVPYKGATPAITALLRSEVAVLIVNLSSVDAYVKAGTLRIIAAAGPERIPMRPDLPTIAESAVPGFSTGGWWGLFGPAGLPGPVVDKIRADAAGALVSPEARTLFATNTFQLVRKTPEQFVQFIRDDLDNWARQIKAAGIQPD